MSIDTKLDKLQIALEVEDNKDGNSEYSDLAEEEKDRRFIQVVFQFILFSSVIQILSLDSLQ